MNREYIFVSYSHQDVEWLDRLRIFLKPFPWGRSYRDGGRLWADPYIRTGDRWRREIGDALTRTRIAVLLVSQDFLASDFVNATELPPLLEAEESGEVTIVCVPLRTTVVDLSNPRLLEYQWPRPHDQPLDVLTPAEREGALAQIFRQLYEVAQAAGLTEMAPAAEIGGGVRRAEARPIPAERGATLGALIGVPAQRPHFIARSDVRDRIRSALLAGSRASVGLTGAVPNAGGAARVGVFGQGGLGKTVSAIDLVHDEEVRRAFPDGILWLDVGQNPDLKKLQATLIQQITGEPAVVESVLTGSALLREALAARACLIVLDDVWRFEDAHAFDVAGERSRLLVTTRDGTVLTALGAEEIALDVLSERQALELLATWSNQPLAALPADATLLVKRCGYVPLAISVAGALIRDGTPWADVLAALEAGNVRFLDHPYGSVFASLRLSVDALPSLTRARYLELAVVPEDVAMPASPVARLWAHTSGMPDYESARMLADLDRKALLYLESDGDDRRVRFHDLQRDFLQLSAVDLRGLHRQFLDALAPKRKWLGDGSHRAWWTIAEHDRYLWHRLALHLSKADLGDELCALLLDYKWVAAKLRVTDITALLSDYDLVAHDEEARLLQRALRFSGHVLARDKRQLAAQLLAHADPEARGRLRDVLDEARAYAGTWLRPLSPTHTLATGPLLQMLTGHTSSVVAVVALDARRVASASSDGTLRVWDVDSGMQLGVLEGPFSSDTSLAVIDSRRVVSTSDSLLLLWDIESCALLAQFAAHDQPVADVAVIDSSSFVSIDSGRTLILWSVDSGAPQRILRDRVGLYASSYARLAVLDSQRILCAPGDFSVELWNVETDERIHRLEHKDAAPAMAVLGAQRFATAAGNGVVREWDASSGEPTRTFEGHPDWIRALVKLADNRLAWALDDGSIQITDLASGLALERFGGHSGAVTALADLGRGRLVSASDDGTLRIWGLGTGRVPSTWASWGAGEEVNAVAFLDGRLLVAAQRRHPPRVSDVQSGTVVKTLVHTDVGVVCRVDQRLVLTGSGTEGARLWNTRTGELIANLGANASRSEGVALLANGRIALTAPLGAIVWNPQNHAIEATLKPDKQIVSVAALDDRRLALGGSEGELYVFGFRSGEALWSSTAEAAKIVMHDCYLAPIDDGEFASARGESIHLWNTATGKMRTRLFAHTGQIEYLAAFNRRHIVSAATDRNIKIWDRETGRALAVLQWSYEHLYPVVAPLDAHHLIWADGTTVSVFELETLTNIAAFTLEAAATVVAGAPDGRTIAVGDEQGNVHTFRLEKAVPA